MGFMQFIRNWDEDSIRAVLNKIHSVCIGHRFFSFGKKSSIDFSCDIRGSKYISIGSDVAIDRDSFLYCSAAHMKNREKRPVIEIGDGASIGRRAFFSGIEKIKIGGCALLGPNVYIADHSHNFENVGLPVRQQGLTDAKGVEIGAGAWIGANVCILPGCSIGKNCVVGANSVVTKSFPDYCAIAGAPAKIIKKYNAAEKKWEKIE